MDSFLQQVANDLISRFGTDLAEVVVVFPSQRARLFFNTYLYQMAGKPIWAPQYLSIDELFEKHSALQKADSIQLIGELYKVYVEIFNEYSENPTTETLDEFYFFGEILLNDFEDVDKNFVDAKLLFHNLKDLDDLKDDFSHLTENQKEALLRFGSLFDTSTYLKDSFLSIWNILGEVYQKFKESLKIQEIAYPGMLIREVVENTSLESFSDKQYVFVGFNVLNKCEEKLFGRLKPKALFYWDYDNYYLNQEAGRFIKHNIYQFGSALTLQETDSFLNVPKEINIITSSSESGQAGMVNPWIDSLSGLTDFIYPDSAIVLCNESILPVITHAIPSEKVENVNITMGFPLQQTPISAFLEVLVDLQTKGLSGNKFHYKYLLALLRHSYSHLIFSETAQLERNIRENNIFFPDASVLGDNPLFRPTKSATDLAAYLLEQIRLVGDAYKKNDSNDVYEGLYQESIFQAYQLVNRLYGLLLSGQMELEKSTFIRLLKKLLSSTKVPFHGEPLKGLQVLGVLETRTLDFKNVLMLSVNEGFMPGSTNENTFIPQFLREYFDLQTTEHQDSIYAYYFYRLLQRSEKITLVYNSGKTGIGKAEISRFLLQLLIDKKLTIKRYTLQAAASPLQSDAITIPKTPEVLSAIKEKFDLNTNPAAKSLSPSALNIFVDCSLRFYWQKIKEYESEEEFSEEMDASVFGTIFHKAAEFLYREIGGIGNQKKFNPFVVQKEALASYADPKNDHHIRRFVSRAFDQEFFKGRIVDESQYNGEQLINFQVICEMLRRMIQFDLKNAPFTIVGLEWIDYTHFDLKNNVRLRIGGIIDRLEEKNGTIRILDYKTGGKTKSIKSLDELVQAKEKRAAHVFQTFVYALVLSKELGKDRAIAPGLYYLQEITNENFTPFVELESGVVEDFRPLSESFENLFLDKLEELFDENIPFAQTEILYNCTYCDFKDMCNR